MPLPSTVKNLMLHYPSILNSRFDPTMAPPASDLIRTAASQSRPPSSSSLPEAKMYTAYGWPQVISLESCAATTTTTTTCASDRVVFLKIINRLLLVVSSTHLELWSASQHNVRLGKYVRNADSVDRERENLQAIWSPDTKSIAVLFPSIFRICCQPPYSVPDASSTALIEDSNVQEFAQCCPRSSAVVQLELSLQLRLLVVLFSSCQIALCSISKKGPKQTETIKAERWFNTEDAMCASVASDQQILAVVCSRGVVELYDLAENATLLRTISLYDWGYELLFYPRYHLDQSSLLYRKALLGKPIVMDVFQDYILVTYRPFDVHIFHVKILGELSTSSTPILQLSAVRELSIMTAKSHPVLMKFIPDFTAENSLEKNNSRLLETSSQQPSRCLILRSNGELSVLDLDDGHEQLLSNSIEQFWVTCGHSEEKSNLIEEVSWLDYGHQGMQLDPEFEFDREVYPLGLLPNIGVVVGVSQRMSFSACSEFPCFEPSPQAQTILHGLLRHLLQRDKNEEVLHLACLSAEKPHFFHCLEWLLFTVFDAEVSRQNATENQLSSAMSPSGNSL